MALILYMDYFLIQAFLCSCFLKSLNLTDFLTVIPTKERKVPKETLLTLICVGS